MTVSIMDYIGGPQKPLDMQGVPPIMSGSNTIPGGQSPMNAPPRGGGADSITQTLMMMKLMDAMKSSSKPDSKSGGGGLFGSLKGEGGAGPSAASGNDAVGPIAGGTAFV